MSDNSSYVDDPVCARLNRAITKANLDNYQAHLDSSGLPANPLRDVFWAPVSLRSGSSYETSHDDNSESDTADNENNITSPVLAIYTAGSAWLKSYSQCKNQKKKKIYTADRDNSTVIG